MTTKTYSVNSSNINAVSYDLDSKELTVTFHSGSSYMYENVEQGQVCRLLFSESAGREFRDSIKNHKFRKL